MRKKDILFVLRNLIEMHPMRKDAYYGALKTLDLLIIDDKRYFTLPIDPQRELQNLENADLKRCGALLSMLLREDYWFESAFDERLIQGWPQKIVQRMITLAEEEQ